MIETWRWYGVYDKISLPEICQTGATGIVTALHGISYGQVWELDKILTLKNVIESSGLDLTWEVVESLPLHENIKMGKGDLTQLFTNYKKSLENLAKAEIRTVCYNFMPVLDWTRTHLKATHKNGGTALRYSQKHMAAFEIAMLERESASKDYSPDVIRAAWNWFKASNSSEREELLSSIMAGLPGKFKRYSLEGLKDAISSYKDIGRLELRKNYGRFLNEVIPVCEKMNIKICVHPDDPPRDILGLPRIVSTEEDLEWITNYHSSEVNGITFCSGSLGASPINDVVAIAERFSQKIFFAHLRNVKKESDGSFQEVEHLRGDTNMTDLVQVILDEEQNRDNSGRLDKEIPFRPDHGIEILWDEKKNTHPGYPLVGRLKGLAELRGVIHALSNSKR